MKKIIVKNGDGSEVTLEVSDAVYEAYVTDKHNEKQREKYRDNHLRDLTENSVLENIKNHSIDNLHDIFLNKEIMIKIKTVLMKCTPTQRRRFDMYFLKQMTMRQIAKEEGVNHSKIQKSISQVKTKFRKYF